MENPELKRKPSSGGGHFLNGLVSEAFIDSNRDCKRLVGNSERTPSDPPSHPRLVGAVGIAELALQIAFLPLNDADVDHPQQGHHQPDPP
jgi:hypothetical protein